MKVRHYKPERSISPTRTHSLTHHGGRDGGRGLRRRPFPVDDLGPLLLVVGDVDGHGVVAEAAHLVRREVLVRRLTQQVLLACNINFAICHHDLKGTEKKTQPDSLNNMQTSLSKLRALTWRVDACLKNIGSRNMQAQMG